MKKIIIVTMLITILFTSSGCSGVNKELYDETLNHNTELEIIVEKLKEEKADLISELSLFKADDNDLEQLKLDKQILQSTLITTYDAYRNVLVYVTTEVYKDSLSQKEWEAYMPKLAETVPTFEEIKKLVND